MRHRGRHDDCAAAACWCGTAELLSNWIMAFGRPTKDFVEARSTKSSDIDPPVQGRGLPRVAREVLHELRDARILPRALEIRPDFRERLPPQVAAHERQ